jgi:UPF0755 protein
MTKVYIYGIITLLLGSFFGLIGFNFYNQFYNYPSQSPVGQYSFEVKTGQNLTSLAKKLEQDKVVISSWALTTTEGWQPISNLQEGTYTLNLPAKPSQILEQIDEQSKAITAQKAEINKRKTAKITLKEGWSADQYFEELAKNGVTEKAELEKFAQNPTNFDRKKFEFLPKPLTCEYGDLKKCQKYYIEGYLYPNTYDFFTPSTPAEVFDRLLKGFEDRVWKQIKDKELPQGYTLSQIITLASIVEKETGRPLEGVNNNNLEELNTEKALIAGVFYNRLEQKIKLESDPTVSYGTGKRLCQKTLTIPDCLFLDSPAVQTLYNTYNLEGVPIGPITSPQFSTINYTINPKRSDFLLFVSDATGKKYFAKNNEEHLANIAKVQEINRGINQLK